MSHCQALVGKSSGKWKWVEEEQRTIRKSIVNRVKEEVMEDSAEEKVTEGENGDKDKDKDADTDNS
jgi:hypothetical protein